ncbi:MAG: hypothetical protein R2715_13425 [Ilumatobacteraceae bacterium]
MISASLNPFTANFAAEYAVCGTFGPRYAQKPLMLLVLMRWASGAAMSSGRNTRVDRYTPPHDRERFLHCLADR